MDLNSDSESEASVEVEVPEATLELHEGANEDEGEEEDESDEEDESEEGVGQTEAAEAARRQAEAEGLTLQLSGNKTGYRGVKTSARPTSTHPCGAPAKRYTLAAASQRPRRRPWPMRGRPRRRWRLPTPSLRRSRPKRQWRKRRPKGSS